MKNIFALLLIISCSTGPVLSEQEKKVRILRSDDASTSCKEMERLQVQTWAASTTQGREDEMKRKAHAIGADTIVLARLNHSNFIEGIAYKCN